MPNADEPPRESYGAELLALIQEGRKLDAIKLYRERTGLGLKEAKDAIEAFERGESPLETSNPAPGSGFEGVVLSLLRQGKKIEAIKVYRKQTGVELVEAKRAVEALAAQHGIEAKGGGCAGVLFAVVFAMSLVVIVVL